MSDAAAATGNSEKKRRGTIAKDPVAVAIQRGINTLEPLSVEDRTLVLKRLAIRYRDELRAAAGTA